jgi:hypothetical protein
MKHLNGTLVGNSSSPSHQGPKIYHHKWEIFLSKDISNLLLNGASSASSDVSLDINLAGSKGARETELSWDPLDAVSRIDVLDESNLVAGGRTLTGDDSGGGQEVFPDLCGHVSDENGS